MKTRYLRYTNLMRADGLRCLILVLCSFASSVARSEPPLGDITVPASTDWTDHGEIIEQGGSGDWDRFIKFYATSLIHFNGTYFLYYFGGPEPIGGNGDPDWRSMGVATSDSILGPWTRHPNPIWQVFPNNVLDEGHTSFVAFVENNVVYMYYNQLRGDPNDVESDIRVMSSTDGINFSGDELVQTGNVLMGDEAWPTGIIRNGDATYLYFSGNVRVIKMMELSGGAGSSTYVDHNTVYDPAANVYAGTVQSLDGENHVMFVLDNASTTCTVHSLTKSSPLSVSGAIDTYTFSIASNVHHAFDPISNQWVRFSTPNNKGGIWGGADEGISLATALSSVIEDTPKPLPPSGLQAD